MTRYLAGLALLCVVAALAPGCDEGDPVKPPVTPPPVDTNWNQGMDLDQLKIIAEALGIELVEEGESSKVTKEDVVTALEKETKCGCFGAVCGTGDCAHECGTCAGSDTCFAGTCETVTSCPVSAPVADTQTAKLRNDTETLKFRYDAELPAGSAFERIRLYYNATVDEPLGPGTYKLRHRSMADCKPCVVAYTGCGSEGVCSQPFIAQAGVVEIDEITPDGRFKGNIAELKFEAAYEDPKTGFFYTTPLLGVECVSKFDFDTQLVSEVIEPEACDPEGNGTGIGNKIGDFALQNCLGEDVQMHSGCGKKALWLIAAAGW